MAEERGSCPDAGEYGFKERFILDRNIVFPDQIWVVDNYALIIADKVLYDADVRLIDNPYLIDLLKE